MKQEY